jgi:hypothetical protein
MHGVGIRANATATDPVSDRPRRGHAFNHKAGAWCWLHLVEYLLVVMRDHKQLDAVPELSLLFFDTCFTAVLSTTFATVFFRWIRFFDGCYKVRNNNTS